MVDLGNPFDQLSLVDSSTKSPKMVVRMANYLLSMGPVKCRVVVTSRRQDEPASDATQVQVAHRRFGLKFDPEDRDYAKWGDLLPSVRTQLDQWAQWRCRVATQNRGSGSSTKLEFEFEPDCDPPIEESEVKVWSESLIELVSVVDPIEKRSETEVSKPDQNSPILITDSATEDELAVLLRQIHGQDIDWVIHYLEKNYLLTQEELQQRQMLVEKIETTLNQNGIPCRLEIFGSSANGLGLRGSSDIDVYVELRNFKDTYQEIRKALLRIGRILTENAGEIFGANKQVKRETICRKHMRVPLTRITVSTIKAEGENGSLPAQLELQIDLNVSHPLGTANTRLLRFLGQLEPRFRALSVLLRVWAKRVADLIQPAVLSSYALSALALYLCQSRQPPILPSIDHLIRQSPGPARFLNQWRCDFATDPSRLRFRTRNNISVVKLLREFFHFYNRFDFEHRQISTRQGRAKRYRNRSSDNNNRPRVHIWDPFELSHNLAARMKLRAYQRFCEELKRATRTYQQFF